MPDRTGSHGMGAGDAASVHLDLSGLKCPLPALRTRRALRVLAPGIGLVVTATDPLAGLDIPNAAREMGACVVHRVCRAEADGTASWQFTIRFAD